MTTEPTDAESATACEIMAGDHQVMFFGWCALHGFGIQGWPEKAAHELRRHLKAMWDTAVMASRLSRRPAAAPEGVRQQCINIAFGKLLTSQAREAVEIADAILALVSPAATRRAALEEVAKWADGWTNSTKHGRRVADHCRRLAQGEGGE